MTDAAAVTTDERVRVCPACDAPAEADETECSFCHAPLSGRSHSSGAGTMSRGTSRALVYSALAGAAFALCGMAAVEVLAAATNGEFTGAVEAESLFVALLVAPFFLVWKGYRAFDRYAFLSVLLVVSVSFVVSVLILVAVTSTLAG